MTPSFDWQRALTSERLRQSKPLEPGDEDNAFLSDYYRIVFSSPFRRLQDKTQVTPLAPTDFVRRRLTHSVEVATIGERMGRVVAKGLKDRLGQVPHDQVGKIVACAALLHDIGNPPFGHEGELAIRDWAESLPDHGGPTPDYSRFDGNAQGFRIAVRLHDHGEPYGMNLTAATLAAYVKYPYRSSSPQSNGKKYGIMATELPHYQWLCETTGLSDGQRHPLSFLVEAADDIVNRLIDIEDGLKVGLLTFTQIREAIESCEHEMAATFVAEMDRRRQMTAARGLRDSTQLAYQHFRVNCITAMVKACEALFLERIADIEDGRYSGELIADSTAFPLYNALRKLEDDYIFGSPDIVRVEAGGKQAVTYLLRSLLAAVEGDTKLGRTIPVPQPSDLDERGAGDHVARVVDYVAGMTDGYAVRLYQQLCGTSL